MEVELYLKECYEVPLYRIYLRGTQYDHVKLFKKIWGQVPVNFGTLAFPPGGREFDQSFFQQGESNGSFNAVTHRKVHCDMSEAYVTQHTPIGQVSGSIPLMRNLNLKDIDYSLVSTPGSMVVEASGKHLYYNLHYYYHWDCQILNGDLSMTFDFSTSTGPKDHANYGPSAISTVTETVIDTIPVPSVSYFRSLTNREYGLPQMDYALYEEAVDKVQLNVNNIENAFGLLSALRNVRHLPELCSQFSKARRFFPKSIQGAGLPPRIEDVLSDNYSYFGSPNIRKVVTDSISSAWLGYRYEYRTTLSDIQEFFDYVERNALYGQDLFSPQSMYKTLRTGKTSGIETHHLTMEVGERTYKNASYSAGVIAGLCNNFTTRLRRSGFAPTAANLWDCIPLSFVVDWIYPVSDVLSSGSDEWLRYYCKITACYSIKRSITYKWYGMDVKYTDYVRSLGAPRYEFVKPDYKVSPSLGVRRIIDGVCLLL